MKSAIKQVAFLGAIISTVWATSATGQVFCKGDCVFASVVPGERRYQETRLVKNVVTKKGDVRKAYQKQGQTKKLMKILIEDFQDTDKEYRRRIFYGLIDADGNTVLDSVHARIVPLSSTHSLVMRTQTRAFSRLAGSGQDSRSWGIVEHATQKVTPLGEGMSVIVKPIYAETLGVNYHPAFVTVSNRPTLTYRQILPDGTFGPEIPNIDRFESPNSPFRGLGENGDYLLVNLRDPETDETSQLVYDMFGQQEDGFDDLIQISMTNQRGDFRYAVGVVGDVPAELNTHERRLFWPYLNGELLEKPPNIAGIVPALFASDSGAGDASPTFEAWIVVVEGKRGYDYALPSTATSNDPIRNLETLQSLERLDAVHVDDSAKRIAIKRLPINDASAGWYEHRYKGNYGTGWSLQAGHFNTSDHPAAAQNAGAAIRSSNAFMAARAEAVRAEYRARKAAEETRQRAFEAEQARQYTERLARIERILSPYQTAPDACEAILDDMVRTSENSQAYSDWSSALRIDRSIACNRIPVALIEASRAAPPRATGTERGFWEEFNARIDAAPRTLRCTKDYAKKIETCRWE